MCFFFYESCTRHSVNTEFRTQTTSVKPQKPGHHKITTPPFRPWQKEMLSYTTLAQLVSHTTANYVVGTTTATVKLWVCASVLSVPGEEVQKIPQTHQSQDFQPLSTKCPPAEQSILFFVKTVLDSNSK